jgi:hypothetical protein
MSAGGWAIACGTALVLLGAAALLLPHGWWPGRLPGDLTMRLGDVEVYLPLASCLLLSVMLTLVLALIRR